MQLFKRDLDFLIEKLSKGSDGSTIEKLNSLRNRLLQLRKDNLVKISHSVMELVCAKHLIVAGYDVDVEHPLNLLNCDIYAKKGMGDLIVEIETGYIPPDHALDPLTYCKARIASKIARYSNYSNKFALGTPPHYIMQIPSAFIEPPRYRTEEAILEIKRLCDIYYKKPPVTIDEIRNGRVHTVYVLDIDEGFVWETDPSDYAEKTAQWNYTSPEDVVLEVKG